MHKVSIIIPVFNRFEYADRAILSVLNQTYTDWELFVVDDSSNQKYDLPEFCESTQRKIELIRNENNIGPGLTRQRGLDLSTGTFICFLDSDDYWLPDFLMRSLETHKKLNFNIGATYCQSNMTDGSLRRRNEICEAVDDIFYGVVSGVRPWATCSLIWNKRFISKWPNLRTNQDAYFEISSSILNNRVSFIPHVLCVIDKNTNFNADDLVDNSESNKNRLTTLIYSQYVFLKYNEIYRAGCFNLIFNRSIVKIKSLLHTKHFMFAIFALLKSILFYAQYQFKISKTSKQ